MRNSPYQGFFAQRAFVHQSVVVGERAELLSGTSVEEFTGQTAGARRPRRRAMSQGGRSGKGRLGPSRNDQRSNVFNPNNAAYKSARDNRSNQMNPQHPARSNTGASGYRQDRAGRK
jgi:hypothetical protein